MRGKQREIGAFAIEDSAAGKRASLADAGGVGIGRACWTSHGESRVRRHAGIEGTQALRLLLCKTRYGDTGMA